MEYRPLGRTGIHVSQLCLGAMMFGAFGNREHDDSIGVIHKALDAGINFIDTADGYSAGESEEILGKALTGGRRDNVVLAVKTGVPFDADPNHRGASRRWLTDAVEGSLRRLKTDWIDLYQVGVPDPNTDIDETLGVLTDLTRAGKIRSFGASKVPASQIVEAQWTADRRGHGRFRTEQPPYNLLTRAIEYDVLPACQRHGIGVMSYSPLAGGWLSGKYRKGQEITGPGSAARAQRFPGRYDATNPANAAKLDAADALASLAEEDGITLIEMAIAFAVNHRPSPPPSSARALWITSMPTSPPTESTCHPICSTASTRSFHRASPSTSRTTCGRQPRRPSPPHSAAAERPAPGSGRRRRARPGIAGNTSQARVRLAGPLPGSVCRTAAAHGLPCEAAPKRRSRFRAV